MMKTKFSLLIFALLFVCSGMMAQDKITIGVIQYDLGDVDKSFKDLHDQGFGSCELNYQKNKFTKDFAEKVKAASKKHNIKGNNGCRCARKPLCLEFSPGTGYDWSSAKRRTGRKN